MEPFTIITPTGDRPETFALCWKYVARQTVLPAEWIIVDDGKEQIIHWQPLTNTSVEVKYIRRYRKQSDPAHTLPAQMIEALPYVNTDRILIVEDDDWYRADYCERMMEMFDTHPNAQLIGQGQAVYYHVPLRKCFQMVNVDRASFCQTGFRSSLIPQVYKACQNVNDPFIDLRLWRGTKEKFLLLNQPPMCVGMKGLPGRVSDRTIGHKGIHPGFKSDVDGTKLKSLIGDDAKLYEKFQGPLPMYVNGEIVQRRECYAP
jgi:hypothetical protein